MQHAASEQRRGHLAIRCDAVVCLLRRQARSASSTGHRLAERPKTTAEDDSAEPQTAERNELNLLIKID